MTTNFRPLPERDYHAVPQAILILHDPAPGAAEALDAAGVLWRGPFTFSEAPASLEEGPLADVIVVEATGATDGAFDALLSSLASLAAERDLPIIVTIDEAQIDLAAHHILGTRSHMLCAPSPFERVEAIKRATTTKAGGVNDPARDAEERLRRLNEEVAQVARDLAQLARPVIVSPSSSTSKQIAIDPREIRAVIRSRRLREQVFGEGLFADPAWDMLLDLFAAGLEGKQVSVSSLCLAAATPPTTALRWIAVLQKAGLVERDSDPYDKRRAFIRLSEKAVGAMRAYYSAMQRADLPFTG